MTRRIIRANPKRTDEEHDPRRHAHARMRIEAHKTGSGQITEAIEQITEGNVCCCDATEILFEGSCVPRDQRR